MSLHTPAYLLFLLLVVLIYWLLPAHHWRKLFLLMASYIFYALFDVRFTVLLFGLSIAVYLLGGRIASSRHRRFYAWLSVGLNLGVLGLFKYAGFFLSSAAAGFQLLGVPIVPPALRFLLPVGLSFYTFQAIAYTTEIYRGTARPTPRILDFGLSMAFFPKLIAGPLVQPFEFQHQIKTQTSRPSAVAVRNALALLLTGLTKKVLIADSLASLSDVAYRASALSSASGLFPSPLYWAGFYLYAIQIYADFSGYTDIARASANLLGFSLPENFRQPYFADSIADFWSRWHMTLTRWFREYLFQPLSRFLLISTKRRFRKGVQVLANLTTMTLIGLWHGAAWTYVAWGFWHGTLISIERFFNLRPRGRWSRWIRGILTFHLVGIGWVLFRAESFANAGRYIVGIFSLQQVVWLPRFLPPVLLAGALTLLIDLISANVVRPSRRSRRFWQPVLVTASLLALSGLALLQVLRGMAPRPFIYGQF
jgi:alginate O-acetyltransferase complex protein AlgI